MIEKSGGNSYHVQPWEGETRDDKDDDDDSYATPLNQNLRDILIFWVDLL